MAITEVYSKLRSYQKEALDMMKDKDRILLFDDMGLGKTVVELTDIESKHKEGELHNFLIFCPNNALGVWQKELSKWYGKESIIYSGTPKQRQKLWQQYLTSYDINYLIANYSMMNEISSKVEQYKNSGRFALAAVNDSCVWHAVVADEIHQVGLLNSKCPTYNTFEKFVRQVPYLCLITGTPIRQGVIDLYGPLHIVDRYRFSNYWSFVNRHCITLMTPFGKSIERRPKNPDELRSILSNYMIRRTKKELKARGDLKDLPGKQRQPLLVEMTTKQRKAHDTLIKDMYYVEGDNVIMAANAMTLRLHLRQLLTCPKLLGIDDYGAALEEIVDRGSDLIDNDNPFIIYTPFREAVPFIKERIRSKIKNVAIYSVSGGMSSKEFTAQWQGFQNSKNQKKVLICVIKSCSSFDAYEASYGFFLGYEWDFNLNEQAEDRMCRLGQGDFVNIYYMMHKGTVDEDVAQRLNDKQEASNWIIGDEEIYALLKKRYGIVSSK